MNGKDVKDFFTSEEYKIKRMCLMTGVFMMLLGCFFVIPVFKTLGVIWTVCSALYTVTIVVRIALKSIDIDSTTMDIKQREKFNEGIEGEKPDIALGLDYDKNERWQSRR